MRQLPNSFFVNTFSTTLSRNGQPVNRDRVRNDLETRNEKLPRNETIRKLFYDLPPFICIV